MNRWASLQVGDEVVVRGKRTVLRATVRVAKILESDWDGPGFVSQDGDIYRRLYFDIAIIDSSRMP